MASNVPRTTSHLAYVPAFDGLRAIAVISVMVYHAEHGAWFTGGWAAVDIFFVLSGFLITSNLKREIDTTGSLRLGRFYARRFLRLMPALWLMLAVDLASYFVRYHNEYIVKDVVFSLFYIMNWVRALSSLGGDELGHLWSLSIEEQFYIVWPAVFLVLKPALRKPILIICISTIILWRLYLLYTGSSIERTYNGFDTHSDGLLIGCFLALIPSRPSRDKYAAKLMVFPLLGLILIILFLRYDAPFTHWVGLSIASLLSAWIISGLQQKNLPSAILAHRIPVFVGKISYGLYLWHNPIIFVLKPKIHHFSTPILLSLSFAAAIFSYYVVEQPFLRLKSRVEPIPTMSSRSIT